MPTKRATVYFEEALHESLRLKPAETGASISDLVNSAVRRSLSEDADDLTAFRERANEPRLSFEAVLRDLEVHGKP